MSHNYYKIISINKSHLISLNGSTSAQLTDSINITDINYKSTLNESLETMQLIKVCKKCGLLKKYFSELARPSSSSNFRGNTIAFIEFNIATPTRMSKSDVSKLYKNGFYFNGERYLRYKRSASSSRDGKCLFIAETLFCEMYNWSSCGLIPELQDSTIDDIPFRGKDALTSWEAYISLTLSGIEDTLSLPRNSILLIPEGKSTFKSLVMNVKNIKNQETKEDELNVIKEEVEIENTIWDGEALLDDSVFQNLKGYKDKSMLLLRNRFFKTCAFRTNLQQWFKDNKIKTIRQLNGFTFNTNKRLSQNVDNILLVITPSSLKYLKFVASEGRNTSEMLQKGLEQWLSKTSEGSHNLTFGIVKTDHPTKHMNGTMVQTNYQLLSTLGLNPEETEQLLAPSINYIKNINNDPSYFLHYLNICHPIIPQSEYDDYNYSSIKKTWFDTQDCNLGNYQYEVIRRIVPYSKNFAKTEIYQSFLKNQLDSFKRRIRHGNILVEGTYATLFGNCIEFLYATIHKDYMETDGEIKKQQIFDGNGTPIETLVGNEIHSSFFNSNDEICGARSPHVTMGNLFYAKNTSNEFINKYFPISSNIVCVNAIDHNIMQRLNGADYDSDTMLITNNSIIVNATKRNYSSFLVPVNSISTTNSKTRKKYDIHYLQACVDTTIFNNYIGKIINLALLYNSLLWDRFHLETTHNAITPEVFMLYEGDNYYEDLCKLAILSNIEIDKAKRTYSVKVCSEFREIEKYAELFRWEPDSNNMRYIFNPPAFYSFLTNKKKQNKKHINFSDSNVGKYYKILEKKDKELKWDCTMHYVHDCMKRLTLKHPKPILLHDLIKNDKTPSRSNDSRDKKEIIEAAQNCQSLLNRIYFTNNSSTSFELSNLTGDDKATILQNTFNLVSKKIRNKHIIHLVLNDIDQGKTTGFNALLFASLVLSSNSTFRDMLLKDPTPLLSVEGSSSSEVIKIYNQSFFRETVKQSL